MRLQGSKRERDVMYTPYKPGWEMTGDLQKNLFVFLEHETTLNCELKDISSCSLPKVTQKPRKIIVPHKQKYVI